MRTKLGSADLRIDTRTERAKLAIRGGPYWLVLEKGRSLGYRKGKRGGEWVARYYDPLLKPTKRYRPLGSADDFADPNGVTVLSCSQAQEAARKWFQEVYEQETGVAIGPVTVAQAVAEYLKDRERAGVKTAKRMEWDFNAHVLPTLGEIPLSRMTKKRIEEWMDAMARSGRRRRGTVKPPPSTPEEILARKATVNRVWTNLKAALNLASEVHGLPKTWEKTKGFKGTQVARIRFLTNDEAARLVNACQPSDFRRLVEGGLWTGAREGELARITVGDFDGSRIWIEPGKTRRGRWVILEDDARVWFSQITSGLDRSALLFPRDLTGSKTADYWQSKAVMIALRAACLEAEIDPLVFHELRHTYASRLLNQGVPLVFVAAQIGDSVKMVEKHYGHLCDHARERAIRGELAMPRPSVTLAWIQQKQGSGETKDEQPSASSL